MKLAIMQPYFFPYLGYFQLLRDVDVFVVYDDVNFRKGGLINRNFILGGGQKQRITLSLQGASPNVAINKVVVGGNRRKLIKTIRQNYKKAPQFPDVFPVIETILQLPETNLALFLTDSLKQICGYLGLECTWLLSSKIRKDNSLRGEDKVLAICEELGAKHYVNLPGGRMLYRRGRFEKRGIELLFIESKPVRYRQFDAAFVTDLSIIDVAMFNRLEVVRSFLTEYELK